MPVTPFLAVCHEARLQMAEGYPADLVYANNGFLRFIKVVKRKRYIGRFYKQVYPMIDSIDKMNNTIKLLYSLLVGVVAALIAGLVHPIWDLTQLLIFGLVVFAVTFILTLLIKRKRVTR